MRSADRNIIKDILVGLLFTGVYSLVVMFADECSVYYIF